MINFIKRVFDIPYSTKGIAYLSENNKYRAYINWRQKTKTTTIHIGEYNTREEAVRARYKYLKEMF